MSNWFPEDTKKIQEMLGWPDNDLGKYLLGAYIEATAERRGATTSSQVKAVGDAIIKAFQTVETLDLDTKEIPLEKALRLAAIEKYEAAGSIFRNMMHDRAKNMHFERKSTKYSKHQSKIASNPRGIIITDDGETTTISKIISKLATKKEFADWHAKELWDKFLSELVGLCLNPEENTNSSDTKKWSISYDFNNERKSITFGQFSNVITEAKRNKKSG